MRTTTRGKVTFMGTERTIRTAAGTLELTQATTNELRGIARYWPMELIGDLDTPDRFGLVFQHGEHEVCGVKLQTVDLEEAFAKTIQLVNRTLIASALPYYLEKGHRGVMVPCIYYKKKAEGMVETGFAFFVGPDAASRESSPEYTDVMFDEELGEGATSMMFDMAFAIGKARKERSAPLLPVIGMDLRPRLAMGGLAMYFVVEGPRVFVVKDPLQEDHPVWEHVVRAGFSKLPYAAMYPAGFQSAPPTDIPRV